jgi:cell division protease FtsH
MLPPTQPKKPQKSRKGSEKNPLKRPRDWRGLVWYVLLGLMIASVASTYFSPKNTPTLDFSQFVNDLGKGKIKEIEIKTSDQLIQGKTKAGKDFKTYYLQYPELMNELRTQNVTVKVDPGNTGWFWSLFLQAFLPFILIGGLWYFIFRQAQGANNQAMSFGRSRATPWDKGSKDKVTFLDVAGVDEAIEELKEIVEFLKTPEKYREIGAKIPKGALLMGPPGTGKTLLARAIAGEANVPFFSLSGSDFVEMFVGVGASRVRDLFEQAKKSQPCIIFVDEIDAVGRHRGAGLGGGHDEREQTLNQLLVEMDGFDTNTTVIIIAATNRPDILDPALLRPGRFDRQIVVDKPDLKGRKDILTIHAKNKKIEEGIDLDILARRTPGFTGADLANLVNEAALLSARRNKTQIGMAELEESIERVIAGPERKSRLISAREKEIVAYHEVGHALVAANLPDADPVHKISILPRGLALGYTLQLPVQDKFLVSKSELEDQIKILMGGRIAEEITFGYFTSGASNDIEKATEIARNYVCRFGMSEKMGTRKYGKSQSYVFLAKDYSDHSKDYSEDTAREIDQEIKRIIQEAYQASKAILLQHQGQLNRISKIIMEKEVIDSAEFIELLKGVEASLAETSTNEIK